MAEDGIKIGAPADEAELRALARYIDQAWSPNPSANPDIAWMTQQQGAENFRVVRVGGRVAGGLGLLPMGQWFGGRSVPMVGLNSVVIAPEHRAAGLARRLLQTTLAEVRAGGFALSALFSYSPAVYRRVGYELAGASIRYQAPAQALAPRDCGLAVRPLAAGEDAIMRDLYAERARRTAGNLDRSPVIWEWLLEGEAVGRYVVERDGTPEGYIVYRQEQLPGEQERGIIARDLVALTPDAGRGLLTFLAGHRSTAGKVLWFGPPAEPLLFHLPNQDYRVVFHRRWMLRLVDARAALEARGYPAALAAELHLDVRDDTLPWNDGRLVLAVGGGRAEAREGGEGRVRVDVRGLAPLYSGALSPLELVGTGYIEGPDADLATLGLVFGGPAPWMPDHF